MKGLKIALVAGLVLGAGFVGGEVDAATKSKAVKKVKVESVVKKPVVKKPVVKTSKVATSVTEVKEFDRYAIPEISKKEFETYGFIGKGIVSDQNGLKFSEFDGFDSYKKLRDAYFNSDIPMAKFYFEKMDHDIMHILTDEYKNDIYKAAEFFKIYQ